MRAHATAEDRAQGHDWVHYDHAQSDARHLSQERAHTKSYNKCKNWVDTDKF